MRKDIAKFYLMIWAGISLSSAANADLNPRPVAESLLRMITEGTQTNTVSSSLPSFLAAHGAPVIKIKGSGDCSKTVTQTLRNEADRINWSKKISEFNLTIKSKISCAANCCSYLPDYAPFSDTEFRLVKICVDRLGKINSLNLKCELE